ncbi:DUF2079 domain-containing protein [Streptomyces sp. ISL-43]|uniref:DUF2079 domain-containing protein n=1 Tax=Streptomyces sp. ISL-43 TaxID=2819183 RepID=UPI001BEB2E85|nr:DUF2079 domain-containing protein [Streptomyces sp. ISL-43]MBT2450441.1 DUF2079 domain-containing protein [Streptomyces sp. ISL-43]
MRAPTGNAAALPPQQTGIEERTTPKPSKENRPEADWWIWAMAGALFFAYMALSLRIHERLLSRSFDLGIFVQVVRSYASGHLPVSEVKGPDFPVLGDHFSPVLALLAPLYWLWPSVKVLLVAQAALVAGSVLPLAFWARRTLGSAAAAVIGTCYGVSWGIASGVSSDFHEWAFALPLLTLSLTALGSGRLHAAAYWALPLLLVKEDLGLTVAVIGLVIAWQGGRGGRRLGILTAAAGVAGTGLALLVLSAFHPGGFAGYRLSHNPGGGAAGGSEGGALELLHQLTLGLITPQEKVTTLILVLAPTLCLALRSPLVLIALPSVLWRLASNYPDHWSTRYHYSLLLMPIVFVAFVDALHRRGSGGRSLYRYLAGSAAVTLLLLPHFPLWQLVQPATWETDPRIAVAHSVMDEIPDGATVQASTYLVPHLADRTSVSLYGWPDSRPHPEWIVVDTKVAPQLRWPLSVVEESIALDRARNEGYRIAAQEDGFVLLNRRS